MESYEKLPPEFKETWIKALESGEYPKGECRLYDPKNNSYCCLGVAGVISEIPKKDLASGGVITTVTPGYEKVPQILVEAGEGYFDSTNPLVWKLTEINDSSDSFGPVVEFIKENL